MTTTTRGLVKHWTVSLAIDEHEGRTRAEARLRTRNTDRTAGVGWARLARADRDIPEIGDAVAVARALSDLGARVLPAATEDIEQVTGQAARLVP